MSATIFIEGAATGPDSKYLQVRCREGFRKLLENCGFTGRMPRTVACGGRGAAFRDFKIAHENGNRADYVALLVDSEEPVADIKQTWTHLKSRDKWVRPKRAHDDQVLLMTTCMETWVASDRQALRKHYGANLQENALPNLHAMESRDRHVVQDALADATRNCKNSYKKGKRSFELLEELRPTELRKHLPSFVRFERVLKARL